MTAGEPTNTGGGREKAAFASVTTLFFAWGFITVTVDPLIAALKTIFSLSYAEVMLTQFAFFMAYGLVSLPAATLIARLGYAQSIVTALGIMALGCLCVPVAAKLNTFEIVLGALFIIASGITVLQVAANPLAASLGNPARSHLRLTLAQAFNSLGTALAPYLASSVMLSGGMFAASSGSLATAAQRSQSLQHISMEFMGLAGLIVLLAVFIRAVRRQFHGARFVSDSGAAANVASALRSRWALLGAAAIFLYVGAEVSIGSAMTNLLHQSDVLGVTLEQGGKLVSLYWGGAMIGRFVGSAILARFRAAVLLAGAAAVAAALCLIVSQAPGALAGWAALSIGLFNSIMFPVIFTLTLERSRASSAATSGLLCLAITGGAILPLLVGRIADLAGLRTAYLVPLVAYACVSAFGLMAATAPAREVKLPQPSH
ncbi:MAG TPA: sugar MFS transporter [Steroidobacteraceae bacterium]|nr:sugar MFS transporter [Steroidobacteraceae bacterium]